MSLSALQAVSPIDGRYRRHTKDLSRFFSESALIKFRVWVEVEYFIALVERPLPQLADFPTDRFEDLRLLYTDFKEAYAEEIKEIEKTTNHDVKAVEYFLKRRFEEFGLQQFQEFIHFGLTSQDINNTAVPLSIKLAIEEVYLPALLDVYSVIERLANDWSNIPMLARTHGQAASPTRLGKELDVFAARIKEQIIQLGEIAFSAKFGGATGNMNAHWVAYPNEDWNDFAEYFVDEVLGLSRSYPTTQIEHYDNLAALFDVMKRINTILIDLDRDIWTYISMDYFKQKIKEGEVGSSAMPHKVNPIDFENSEGNFGIANAICEHLAAKLPISRLQRDLTDSTVLRNVGVPFAHALIGLKSLEKGLGKLIVNQPRIAEDLEKNWAVVAEAIQTILRREGYPKPYEALKELTRVNSEINEASIAQFIGGLDVNDSVKQELLQIRPENYTGK